MKRNKYLILNGIFLTGMLILFLNDQFWKFKYPGLLTGKLSDICGIIVFPMLLSYVFPRLKQNSVFAAAAIFTFWKSEYAQTLIDLYNRYSFIPTSRIIDYSDLFVLLLLPLPYYLIKNSGILERIAFDRVKPALVLLPTVFILLAESPPPSYYYTITNGNLKCHQCEITVAYSQEEILNKLEQSGIVFDSVRPVLRYDVVDPANEARKYLKSTLIIDSDTLRNVDFTLLPLKKNKTRIYFSGMDVPQDLTHNFKLEKKLRKFYKKLIFDQIRRSLH